MALTLLGSCAVVAQTIEQTKIQTLTLDKLFDAAVAIYPTLLAARLEARASTEDVAATELIRWPTVMATVESYSGNARSYPSRGLQIDQTVWDFGRNTARISESQALAEISSLKVYLQQQDIFLQMTGDNLHVHNNELKNIQNYPFGINVPLLTDTCIVHKGARLDYLSVDSA